MVNYTLMSIFFLFFYFIGLDSAETEFEKLYTQCCIDMKNENLMYYDCQRSIYANVANLPHAITAACNRYDSTSLSQGYAYTFIKNYKNDNLKSRYKNPYSFCVALKSYKQPYKRQVSPLSQNILLKIYEECLYNSNNLYYAAENLDTVLRILLSNQSINKGYVFTFTVSSVGKTLKENCKDPTKFCQALFQQEDPFNNT
ncbi:uncharacterized protein LOC113556083 isoform X2 [Rhopalosiphum maidis]|uniref:uncharacterized protein LOC113556083 isoform X2 n=1 Tax=Rhopalosiphum maidis TaxID=43146 RepID=UPI000EFDBFB1|nr:uncharacterized protein LOC113556083 isoform X2 [Rhopalosiphum maidis]